MTVPYSSPQTPFLGQIKDVDIDNIQNANILQYDSSTRTWKNVVGGGGGGSTITGTNNAVVFKTGTNAGEGDNLAITRTPASSGYTMNLDTANKFVGINQPNPSVQLDIAGGMHITDGANKIEIDGENLGIISGTDVLTLFSHNTNNAQSNLRVNSLDKKAECSAWRSNDPASFDAPNTTDESSIYKIRLRGGTTKQSSTTPAFDIQENYNAALGFPTSQIVEYQNKVPLNKAICVSRSAGPQTVAPATVRVVSSLGTYSGTFFTDTCLYDPCQMRAKKTGNSWLSFGAPVVYRRRDLKVGWTINWSIHGTWSSGSSNRADVYIVQYRNGVLLRNILVQQLEQDNEFWCIGSRTLLSWSSGLNEDFDPTRDYYEVEIANQSTHNFTFNSADITAECWLAQ